MNTSNGQAAILSRTRRLVELYQSQVITESSLIGEVADLVTPDIIDQVIDLLPPEVRTQLREWARRLPMPDAPGIVCWPLPDSTTLAFKAWLKRQEMQECAGLER